jgi:hypothetical protein
LQYSVNPTIEQIPKEQGAHEQSMAFSPHGFAMQRASTAPPAVI